MYEKAAFCQPELALVCSMWDQLYLIHYSVNRINEVYVKTLNFIYSILWNFVTVCFAAIELVIVLVSASRYVASASRYRSSPSMYIRGLIPRIWPRQFRMV